MDGFNLLDVQFNLIGMWKLDEADRKSFVLPLCSLSTGLG
jgi:hypothetical protein